MSSHRTNQYAARARASRAIRHGMVAAAVAIARATMGVFFAAAQVGATGFAGAIWVVVLAVLSYGLLRRSRACAVALCAALLLEVLATVFFAPNLIGLVITLVLLAFVARAAVGTFEVARLSRHSPTPTGAPSHG